MPNDKRVAEIARRLVEALRDVAYTRKDEDKKRIPTLHTELCAAVKQEEHDDAEQRPNT